VSGAPPDETTDRLQIGKKPNIAPQIGMMEPPVSCRSHLSFVEQGASVGERPESLPADLTRRHFLRLGGVTVTASLACVLGSCGGASEPEERRTNAAGKSAAQLNLDFEDNAIGSPVTSHSGARTGAAFAHSGEYGCRLDPTSTGGQTAHLDVNAAGFDLHQPWATYSMFFRLVTSPKASDQYMNLFEIGNTATEAPKSQFTVFFRNSRLTCDFNFDETLDLAPQPAVDDWHQIQAKVFFGGTKYLAHVRYDGGEPVTLTSSANKTAQAVRVLWIHYPGGVVHYTMDVDDIVMSTSSDEPDWLS
jgi:hypothetical protein